MLGNKSSRLGATNNEQPASSQQKRQSGEMSSRPANGSGAQGGPKDGGVSRTVKLMLLVVLCLQNAVYTMLRRYRYVLLLLVGAARATRMWNVLWVGTTSDGIIMMLRAYSYDDRIDSVLCSSCAFVGFVLSSCRVYFRVNFSRLQNTSSFYSVHVSVWVWPSASGTCSFIVFGLYIRPPPPGDPLLACS